MSAPRDGHAQGMTREQIAAAFGVPLESVPAGGGAFAEVEAFSSAMRALGKEVSKALGLEHFVARLARTLGRHDEARQRLRGMVERNAMRPRLTVQRADLQLVLDELDAHRARLGDQ